MNWTFSSDRPIYLQLQEQLKLRVISGVYPPGRLPSVRDMASEASVNPNTLQKALEMLEREGFVYSQRTSGRFVTEDTAMIEQAKTELAAAQVEQFFLTMKSMGYDRQSAAALVESASKEMK